MADVFISYAREDREEASILAKALEAEGYSVWWDRQILGGDSFDVVIERELDAAGSVVVLWSQSSVVSTWVRAEAATAAERGVLIPAYIEDIRLPLQFRQKQTVDLTSWRGDPKAPEFLPMQQALAARLGRGRDPRTPPSQLKPRRDGRPLERRAFLFILLAVLCTALGVVLAMHFYSSRGEDSAPESADVLPAASLPSLREEEPAPATQTTQSTPVQAPPTPEEREPEERPTPEPARQETREGSSPAKPGSAAQPARPSLCEKYGSYTAESWRRNFLHETETGKWHVFVASLNPGESAADAEGRAQELRRKHMNHDFRVMQTVNPQETGNGRYAVVMAQGVASGAVAREIAAYADRCGIAPGAYAYQQTLEPPRGRPVPDYWIGLQVLGLDDSVAEELSARLKQEGYRTAAATYRPDDRPSWFAQKSTVFHYADSSVAEAKRLARLLKAWTGQDFVTQRGAGLAVDPDYKETTFYVHYFLPQKR